MARTTPLGAPDPTVDVAAFLAWHRTQPYAAFRMEGPDDPPAAPGTPAPPAAPPADAPRTFTQDEVSRMNASEKAQGERLARRKLAEELGLDPETFDPSKVKATLDAQAAARAAQESEAERRIREADEREAAANAREAAATALILSTRKTTALLGAGLALPDDASERDAALGQAAALLDIPADAGDDAVRTAVETLRTRFPGLFVPAGTIPPAPPRAPAGGPTGTPPRQQPPGDAFSRGAERAKALAGPGTGAT